MSTVERWEEYLWTKLKIVPVQDLKAGVIKLLDIFVQNGPLSPHRDVVRIGSMLNYGDTTVEGWLALKEELSKGLESLRSGPAEFPFSKDFEGHPRNYNRSANSSFLQSLFQFCGCNFARNQSVAIELRSPFYHKFDEDRISELMYGCEWKPNIAKIDMFSLKGTHDQEGTRSRWSEQKPMELWVVTELKYAGSFGFHVGGSMEVGVNVNVPGAEIATGLPVAVESKVKTSSAESRLAADPAKGNILYGFKAVRVTFDAEGNFVSREPTMGEKETYARAGESEFNPDEDPEYHMGGFFVANSGGEEGNSSSSAVECLPQVFIPDYTSREDDTSAAT